MKRLRTGQGLLEFALVAPILLILLLGIFDFSRVLITFTVASNSLRTGLRYAAVLGYNENQAQFANCAAMRQVISQTMFAGTPTTRIYYQKSTGGSPQECTGSTYNVNDLANGDMLQITMDTNVRLITPLISNIVPNLAINLRGQRTIVNFISLTNQYETDKDFDGLTDSWENANLGNTDQTGTDDPDGDRCNNGCEETRGTNPNRPDTDNDCLDDGGEAYVWDTDPLHPDSDRDGLWDGREANPAADPLLCGGAYTGTNPTDADSDDDGVSDGQEVANGSNPLVPDPCSLDVNHPDCDQEPDGLTNAQEAAAGSNPVVRDSDNDTIWDGSDAGPTNACVPSLMAQTCDEDGDGWTKAQEEVAGTRRDRPDTDDDGIIDPVDSSPLNSCVPNSGVPACDPLRDSDGDGTPDITDPSLYNACVPNLDAGPCDRDGDGLPNNAPDPAPMDACVPDLNAGTCDQDGDGLTRAQELGIGTNPALADSDGDTLNDGQEQALKVTHACLNPLSADSEADGWNDNVELTNGTNPCLIDSPVLISIADPAAISEPDSGAVALVFVVSLSQPNPLAITLNFTTTGVTAAAAADFSDTNGSLTIPANQSSATLSIPVLGDALDESNETFTVSMTPVNPNMGTITRAAATGTINDNDPQPGLSVGDVTWPENGGPVTISVTLDDPSSFPINVNYATANGTATAGADYTATSGTAAIAAGQTSATFTVPVLNSLPQVYEGNETFTVTLSAPTNATISRSTATVTIADDDVIPTLTVTASPNPILETNGNVTFTVTQSAASTLATTVNYATTGGTATSGQDFTATSGVATIPAGQLTTTFQVPVRDDVLSELSETFTVNLSGAVNAVLSTTSLTITITDNEDTDGDGVADASDPYPNNRPTLSVANTSARQHGSQTRTMTTTVTLRYPNPGQAYGATLTTVNGTGGTGAVGGATCTSPADFITQALSISFAAGSANGATTSNSLTICPGSESQNETFSLVLSNPSPATTTLGAPAVATINK